MARDGLTVRIKIDGVRPTLAALGTLPKDAQTEIREASAKLAGTLARSTIAAGTAEGRQAAIVAPTVKVRRDRLPVIEAGGGALIGRNRKPAFKLLFGSEFGATVLKQYKPRAVSYWFFKTVEDQQTAIGRAWNEAADKIIDRFGRG